MDKFLSEIWGSDKLFLDMKKLLIGDERLLAVLMATNQKNYDRFIAIYDFRDILNTLNLKANIYSVQSAQVGIINALLNSKISKNRLLDTLKRLQNEAIITALELENLENFINSISADSGTENQNKNNEQKDFFHTKMDNLDFIYEKLLSLCNGRYYEDRLKKAKQKNSELVFNVVVTGVVNAGKSTLLNALLGTKVLGTSNVPETVNLTILKHSDNSFARVKFWNESELRELDLDINDDIKRFVGKEIEIKPEELKGYTTAQNEISKAVKTVELYKNLELLRDGICIVDTPGIDDVVFLREEIARRYMNECDLMVHLMNVSQSATQKDVEFLINSLKSSNIVRLVVVLTHADLLQVQDLSEVINYTKKSLEKELKTNGLDKISSEINFFTISAKKFFEGDEDSGVDSFKEYLYEIFFGQHSEKSRLVLEAYKKELISVASEFLEETKESLLHLTGSNLELSQNLKNLKERKDALAEEFKAIEDMVIIEFEKIDINSLDADFLMSLRLVGTTLKDRILNEVDFAKRRKENIDEDRIKYIIQTSLNDGLLATARIKRNEILRRIKSCATNISLKFADFKIDVDEKVFNIGDYLSAQGISFGYMDVAQKICKFLNSKELENSINTSLEEFLKDEKIANFVFNLIKFEKDEFEKKLNAKIRHRRIVFEEDENRLAKESEILSKTGGEIAENLIHFEKLRDGLSSILEELKDA